MSVQWHEVASYASWTTEAIEKYRERIVVYMQTDRGWKAGPGVLAMLNAELRARGVDV